MCGLSTHSNINIHAREYSSVIEGQDDDDQPQKPLIDEPNENDGLPILAQRHRSLVPQQSLKQREANKQQLLNENESQNSHSHVAVPKDDSPIGKHRNSGM